MDLILSVFTDIQPGRLTESLIFLCVLWWKVKPHLKRIEDEMGGMKIQLVNINESMKVGEKRFENIEGRLVVLETKE